MGQEAPPSLQTPDSSLQPESSRAEPVFFGPAERPRAGWIHRTAAPSSSGVVICNPFGYEAICSHRSLRRMAEVIASAGLPVLRFDYDGTGDSAGDDRDPDRLGAWIASTVDACRALRDACGVDRVWLVGVRLGALVALLAAAEADASGLVAIAPVVSGKTYLRELAALQLVLDLGDPPSNGAPVAEEGAQEATGFVLTAETRAAITAIDLSRLERPMAARKPPFEVLVLDREDLPSAGKWVRHLTTQGTPVSEQSVPGYVEMMLDPHKTVVPHAMIGAVTDWISARVQVEGEAPPSRSRGGDLRKQAEHGDVIEEPVFVDSARRIFGMLARPRSAPVQNRVLLLLNSGAVHHVGPNRLYVALARRWAATGYDVLRLDVTGVGESLTRPGQEDNVAYGEHAIDDVAEAVEWLRRERGARDIRAVGLCSGAYHAIAAALAGLGVSGYVAINPLTFRRPTVQLDYPSYRVAREADRYQRAVRDLEKWKKLLRGEVRVRAAAETIVRHAAARVIRRARDLSRRLHMPWKDDVGADLELLASRGLSQHFIFSSGDPGRGLLRDQAGSAVAKLQKRGALAIDVIEGPDHTFTSVWSHAPLIETVTAAITQPRTPRTTPMDTRSDSAPRIRPEERATG